MTNHDVILFPYLSLDQRIRVGPWELIPRKDLCTSDTTTEAIFALARQHLGLYALPDGDTNVSDRCGCYARPANGKIGDPGDRNDLGLLRLSVLVGVLIENPEPRAVNPGLYASTSDNVLAYGHPLNPEGALAIERGVMMRTQVVESRSVGIPRA